MVDLCGRGPRLSLLYVFTDLFLYHRSAFSYECRPVFYEITYLVFRELLVYLAQPLWLIF